MDWKKYFCPICGIDFTDEDDVVVCPDCGTPHHRECWINKGHCANEALHGTEDSLECTYKKASCEDEVIPELVSDDKSGEYTSEAHTHTIFTHDFNQNEQNENGQQPPRPSFNINGKPGVLYEIALRKNQKYYIPRFIVMDQGVKGTGWNFMAFICPLAWCIYRKMYKLAAIILAVYMALMGASVYSVMQDKPLMEAFNECYEEDTQFLVKVAAYSNEESGATLTPKQQKFFELTEKFTIPSYIYCGTLIVSYAMKFAAAIFVNKLYFAKLTKSIETAESKGLEGDALKIYLYKKNGVLPLIVALIIGFVEYSFM
jgi:hypothetical protein